MFEMAVTNTVLYQVGDFVSWLIEEEFRDIKRVQDRTTSAIIWYTCICIRQNIVIHFMFDS